MSSKPNMIKDAKGWMEEQKGEVSRILAEARH